MVRKLMRGVSRMALAAAVVAASLVVAAQGAAQARQEAPARQAQSNVAAVATGLYDNISGLVMDAGGARKSGVTVVLHSDGTQHGKRWLREADGTIRPSYDTGLCLTVPKARYATGVKLDVETCKRLKNQHFAYPRASGSTPSFAISPDGNRRLCASTATGQAEDGHAVTLAACGNLLTAPEAETWGTAAPASNVAGIGTATLALAAGGTTAGSAVVAANDNPWSLATIWDVTTETVAPFGTERVLHPLSDTSLCVTLAGAEASGTALRLEKCTGTPAQAFMGIETIDNLYVPWYFITEPDGRFCMRVSSAGHPVVLGGCVGTAADSWMATTWSAGLDLLAGGSFSYSELYDNNEPSLAYVIGLSGTKAVLQRDAEAADQVWTDLPPSGAGLPSSVGNSDGSISLRPLSDTSLCLTVPGAHYVPGQQLSVSPCSGAVDQDFFRYPDATGNSAIQELFALGDEQLCVTAATLKAGTAITLAACGNVATQSWQPMTAWYQWGGGNVSGLFSYDGSVVGEPLTVGTGTPAPAETAPILSASPTQSWLLGQTSFHPLANTNWCLTAPSAAAGQQLTVQTCDGSASQSFTLTGVPGGPAGALELRPAEAPALCMTSTPGLATAPVTLQPCSATEGTQWWTTW